MYRVLFKRRITDSWKEAYFNTFVSAKQFKNAKRAGMFIAIVQAKHSDGSWVG
jgi:hypothetical protein